MGAIEGLLSPWKRPPGSIYFMIGWRRCLKNTLSWTAVILSPKKKSGSSSCMGQGFSLFLRFVTCLYLNGTAMTWYVHKVIGFICPCDNKIQSLCFHAFYSQAFSLNSHFSTHFFPLFFSGTTYTKALIFLEKSCTVPDLAASYLAAILFPFL